MCNGIKRFDKKYIDYINSDEWKKKAQERKELDEYRCVLCGSTESLQVHHRHYRTFKHENVVTDLITLCADCHTSVHENKDSIINGIISANLIIHVLEKDKDFKTFLNSSGIVKDELVDMYTQHINNGMRVIAIPVADEGAITIPFYSNGMAERDMKMYADYLGEDLKELYKMSSKLYYIALDDGGVVTELDDLKGSDNNAEHQSE